MATTYTTPGLFISKAACTTGTESAPSGATHGIDLTEQGGIRSIQVTVEANDGATNLTAASVLQYYFYNPLTSAWARGTSAQDLVLVGGAVRETFPAVSIQPIGRVAYVPSGLGTAVNVYIHGGGEAFASTERNTIGVYSASGTSLSAQAVGNVAHDAVDSGNPVKIGGKAYDPASMPSDVTASNRVNATFDLKGRQYVYMATTLDSTNDSVSEKPTTHSNTNTSAYATNLVVKNAAGRCYEIRGYSSKASAQFIQVHDSTSLPADASVPEETFTVPATSNFTITFPRGKSFSNGIVVCNSSTGATKTIGSADCWFSADYE